MPPMPAQNRRGFTLMELLVVIAIIALLVSILMPSLQAAKSLARQAVCQSTLHTMALANGLYMNEYDGFSVHGEEEWVWWSLGFNTGYDLPLEPTDRFDDDWDHCGKGILLASGNTRRNEMNNGGQNLPGVGALMYDKFLEESAGAIGCPQADFDKLTPLTLSDTQKPASYQDVVKYMAKPRIDPKKPGGLDPNDYWRNDALEGTGSATEGAKNAEARSNYTVRGPMFRTSDIVYLNIATWIPKNFPSNARAKPDPEIALFCDYERQDGITRFFLGSGANWEMDFPDPPIPSVGGRPAKGWTHWPKRHSPGVNVAYVDGHVTMFKDETRRKTFARNTGNYGRNDTYVYGNGYALIAHVYDTPE